MKRFLPLFLVIAMALTQACEGPEGPQGPAGPQGTPGTPGAQGPQGPPGESAADSAQVFDIPEINFTADNQYTIGLEFNEDSQLGPTDIMLAYRFVGTLPNSNVPFWSALPQTTIVNNQSLTYNFAYSSTAFIVSLDSQADLAGTAFTDYTTDQVFRFVVIPGKAGGGRTAGKPLSKADLSKYPIDLNDYNAVVKYFKINDSNVRKMKLK